MIEQRWEFENRHYSTKKNEVKYPHSVVVCWIKIAGLLFDFMAYEKFSYSNQTYLEWIK